MNSKVNNKIEGLRDQTWIVLRRLRILWAVYLIVLLLSFGLFAFCTSYAFYNLWRSFRWGVEIPGYLLWGPLWGAILLGIYFVFVLRPLISIFRIRFDAEEKLERIDNKALFDLIAETGTMLSEQLGSKAADLFSSETDVLVDNDCFVTYHYRKFSDCLWGRKMVLSIGLPGIMSMNKSEFKAFLTRALAIRDDVSSRIGLLANYSLLAFVKYDQFLFDGSFSNYGLLKKISWLFAYLAMVFLASHVNKLTDEVEELSIYFDLFMDNVSAWISGKDACIYSIVKNDYLTDKWAEFYVKMKDIGRDEGIAPQNVIQAFGEFAYGSERTGDVDAVPEGREYLKERVDLILLDSLADESAEEEMDETPALSLFDPAIVQKVFNSTPDEISRKCLGNRKLVRKIT